MADKGFDLKVLIPTDDGLNLSENGIEGARYFLTYNLSNRSYQLAGKVKTMELFQTGNFNYQVLNELIEKEKVDLIVNMSGTCIENIICKSIVSREIDIGQNLVDLIDKIDKKELI